MVLLFYTSYISVDFAHHKKVGTKVGKGAIYINSQSHSTIWFFNSCRAE